MDAMPLASKSHSLISSLDFGTQQLGIWANCGDSTGTKESPDKELSLRFSLVSLNHWAYDLPTARPMPPGIAEA